MILNILWIGTRASFNGVAMSKSVTIKNKVILGYELF